MKSLNLEVIFVFEQPENRIHVFGCCKSSPIFFNIVILFYESTLQKAFRQPALLLGSKI